MNSTTYLLAQNLEAAMSASQRCNTRLSLAKRSGVGQSTVGRILRAEQDPSAGILVRLAKALDIEPHTLLIDPNTQKSSQQPLPFDRALEHFIEITKYWGASDFERFSGSVKALQLKARNCDRIQ